MIILILIMLICGFSFYYIYTLLFKKNIRRALSKEEVIKFPDLKDLAITYIIFCTVIIFSVSMNRVSVAYDQKVTSCREDNVLISSLKKDYGFCINEFGNIIFKNQKEALEIIEEDYKILIAEIENEAIPVSSDNFDNVYWKLENSRGTDERQELYLLYSIYLNYYETHYVDLKYERTK